MIVWRERETGPVHPSIRSAPSIGVFGRFLSVTTFMMASSSYQQLIADGNLAACRYLCIDAHIDMAEGALERGDDVEIALRGSRIHLGCCAPRDRRNHAQPCRPERDLRADPVVLA